MAFRHWFLYFGVFGVFTLLMSIGDSAVSVGSATDLNDAVGFQVDQIGSGSGFFGTARQSVDFLISFIPKAVSFNYSFLNGDLSVVRWIFILMFGGTFIAMMGMSFLGILQRNV